MEALIAIATLPILVLNLLGGIVGFIWLAVLGQWGHIGAGVGAMILMPMLFGIAQLPGMGAALLASWCADRGWRLPAIACIFLASLWTSFLIAAWCILVAAKSVHDITANNKIPILLWGYAVAVGPLGYMAGKERDNAFTGLQTLLAQVFYVSLIACWAFDGTFGTYLVFTAIMLLTFPALSLFMGAASLVSSRSQDA